MRACEFTDLAFATGARDQCWAAFFVLFCVPGATAALETECHRRGAKVADPPTSTT